MKKIAIIGDILHSRVALSNIYALKKLGAEVVEGNDFIEVTPPETLNLVDVDTYDDHRIAMCFSMAAVGGQEVIINDPKCTAKTFPTYFDVLASLSTH